MGRCSDERTSYALTAAQHLDRRPEGRGSQHLRGQAGQRCGQIERRAFDRMAEKGVRGEEQPGGGLGGSDAIDGVVVWTDDRGGVDQPGWVALAEQVLGPAMPRRVAKKAAGKRR